MPCFPEPGTVTVCEINRDLFVTDILTDDRAKDTYGKLLGFVFSPVSFQPDFLDRPNLDQTTEQELTVVPHQESSHFVALESTISEYIKRLVCPAHLIVQTEVGNQGVSWNPHKHTLAFISGVNQVMICDYDDSEAKDPFMLTSELQKDVKALEWRPNSGKMLSVACKGGICIWSASYPGNAAMVKTGTVSSMASFSRSSKLKWVLLDFLRSQNDEHISALSWKLDGKYLASASWESSSFTIWDLSKGLGTPLRRGLGAITMLKWSPSGDYFFTAKSDGSFYLWETSTWMSEPWSSSGGHVTGACWDPDSRMVLISFAESATLGAIYFSSRPPSLDAHLVPLELPEIASTGSHGIDKLAWDSSGERLALSYRGGDETTSGLIAIFDTRRSPLVSMSLIGFVRGPGEKPRPVAFGFHNKFKQGPLLSVCWSNGWCCTYPLLLRSHLLP